MFIPPSELIINPDNSIYHLHLRPGELAPTIITVGDSGRVDEVAKYFDTVELRRSYREFKTVTGTLNRTRISVVSTGIGCDNIDIVINEIDALFNIDFSTRQIKKDKISLKFIRLGTSGAIRQEIPLDSLVMSCYAIGNEGLIYSYHLSDKQLNLNENFKACFVNPHLPYYATKCDDSLRARFSKIALAGITYTANGFYGPQSRNLRLKAKYDIPKDFAGFEFEGLRITNLEMETSGIYALSQMLGHQAISISSILANRVTNEFSSQSDKTIDKMIEQSLEVICAK